MQKLTKLDKETLKKIKSVKDFEKMSVFEIARSAGLTYEAVSITLVRAGIKVARDKNLQVLDKFFGFNN